MATDYITYNFCSTSDSDAIEESGLNIDSLGEWTDCERDSGASFIETVLKAEDIDCIEIDGECKPEETPTTDDVSVPPTPEYFPCCLIPTVMVTMDWTDDDETKDWLGLTWDNGETKELVGEKYKNDSTGEHWTVSADDGADNIGMSISQPPDYYDFEGIMCKHPSATMNISLYGTSTNVSTGNAKDYDPTIDELAHDDTELQDRQFGQLEGNDGIHVSWSRGDHW